MKWLSQHDTIGHFAAFLMPLSLYEYNYVSSTGLPVRQTVQRLIAVLVNMK